MILHLKSCIVACNFSGKIAIGGGASLKYFKEDYYEFKKADFLYI